MQKTFVIGINLHGEIPIDSNCQPEMIKVPNNYILKLNAVAPGVPNISTIENYNNLGDTTQRFVKENNWLNDPMMSSRLEEEYKSRMRGFVTTLKDKFIEENKDNVAGIESEYFTQLRFIQANAQSATQESHIQKFVHNKDHMYRITQFSKGDLIENKVFSKFTPEQIEQYGINEEQQQEDKGFNKIVIYNFLDGSTMDIFQLIPDVTEISLSDLINFLLEFAFSAGVGIDNLILIDLSCSTFSSEEDLSSTATRCLRRGLIKSTGYDGVSLRKTGRKNGRKLSYKNKNKKNKKVKKARKTKKIRK
jgi:hypothetical protein